MSSSSFIKIRSRFWRKIKAFSRNKFFYQYLYRSKWHRIFFSELDSTVEQYLTAIPNKGAGIGHQMANWIAGYAFAEKFQLGFLHTPFSDPQWENFLNFGRNEIQNTDLEKQAYKK